MKAIEADFYGKEEISGLQAPTFSQPRKSFESEGSFSSYRITQQAQDSFQESRKDLQYTQQAVNDQSHKDIRQIGSGQQGQMAIQKLASFGTQDIQAESKSQILADLQLLCELITPKEPNAESAISSLFLRLQNYYHQHIERLKTIVCQKQEDLNHAFLAQNEIVTEKENLLAELQYSQQQAQMQSSIVQNLTLQAQNLQQELKQTRFTCSNIEIKLAQSERDLAEIQSQVSFLRSENLELKASLSHQRSENQDLKSQVVSKDQELSLTRIRNDETLHTSKKSDLINSQNIDSIKSLKLEVDILQQMKNTRENEIMQLRQNLRKIEDENTELNRKILELEVLASESTKMSQLAHRPSFDQSYLIEEIKDLKRELFQAKEVVKSIRMNKYEDIYNRFQSFDNQTQTRIVESKHSAFRTPEKTPNSLKYEEKRPFRNSVGGGIRRHNPDISGANNQPQKQGQSLGRGFEVKKVDFDSPWKSGGKKTSLNNHRLSVGNVATKEIDFNPEASETTVQRLKNQQKIRDSTYDFIKNTGASDTVLDGSAGHQASNRRLKIARFANNIFPPNEDTDTGQKEPRQGKTEYEWHRSQNNGEQLTKDKSQIKKELGSF